MQDSIHIAVLVEEAMLALDVQPGGRYLDGTLGGATHTEEILKRSGPDGRVVSLDVDPQALARAKDRLQSYGDRWIGVERNFRHLATVGQETGMAPFDGILLDLGFSSDELADPSKGLSFLEAGPLDMRFGPHANEDGLTAAEIVNSWTQHDVEKVIRNFGEENHARRIAEAIVRARKFAKILDTQSLVSIIKSAVPSSYEQGRIHPATRTFQALRIIVNDEMEALKEAIEGAKSILRIGGRLAIITFHSLEDRIVKDAFRSSPDWKPFFKKPVAPSDRECAENPRARSAKLRVAIKL